MGSISALAEAKNLELFIKSVPTLQQQFPEAIFVIVGSGYWEYNLKQLAEKLKANVFFIDYSRDIGKYIKMIDIFVITSWYEGFPLTLLEAAISRKAVVASPVGAVPELIKHGENGLILEDYEVDTFCRNVGVLLESEELRRSMGEKAYKTVVDCADVRDTVKKTEAFYRSIAGRNSQSLPV